MDKPIANRPILCLDFDGVLHSYKSGWKGADKIDDEPVDGSMIALLNYIGHFNVHVHSSRSHQEGGRDAMINWLEKHLKLELSPSNADLVLRNLTFPLHKPSARVTLDDRAITFRGRWPSIDQLIHFQPWHKGQR